MMVVTRIRTLGYFGCVMLALSGCGRFSDSGWNPTGWFGGSSEPATLDPEGGYPTAKQDGRVPVAAVTGAKWDPLYEGRILVARALPATKGWWDLALVTEVPMPPGRISPDENGVLRLRLMGKPPAENSFEAANAANPAIDTANVALTISNTELSRIREVVISAGNNAVTLRP